MNSIRKIWKHIRQSSLFDESTILYSNLTQWVVTINRKKIQKFRSEVLNSCLWELTTPYWRRLSSDWWHVSRVKQKIVTWNRKKFTWQNVELNHWRNLLDLREGTWHLILITWQAWNERRNCDPNMQLFSLSIFLSVPGNNIFAPYLKSNSYFFVV